MALGLQLPGVNSVARRNQRVKTCGPGTLRMLDFKNPASYPSGVVPATSIPANALLSDLPDRSVATPSHPATALGAALIQTAQGSLKLGSGSWSTANCIKLPGDFKLPALNGLAGRYLIILPYKPVSAAAAAANESIAGWATNTSSANNWSIYRNSGNANTFASVGNGGFVNFGVLSAGWHRLALEIIKEAGTIQANAYVDGALAPTGTGAAASLAAIPQPAGDPYLGANGFGNMGALAVEYGGAEIRDLTLDTKTAAEIVAADWAAWATRFS